MIGRRSRTSPRSSGYCSSRPNACVHRQRRRDRRSRAGCRAVRRGRAARRSSAGSTRSDTRNTLSSPGRRLLRLQPVEHRHRFGRRGALVEQRRGRDVHAGEVLHDRLEVQQRLEPALRDLRLVRRVGRVPAGILEHVAQDDARRDAVVVAHADVRARDPVAAPRSSAAGAGSRTRCRLPADRAACGSRMPGGIVWSISASSDGTPMARSIASRAAASGPMCLLWKVPRVDSVIVSCSGVRVTRLRGYFVRSL